MKKRIFSLVLAVLSVLLSFPITAFAANDSFADTLRKQGFPESYIPTLTALHNKYPNWEFEALITNETLSYAVSQERKTHSQQLIEKYSANDGKGFYCTCPDCYDKNTSKKNIDGYIVKEAPNWVSASQSAVEYYMDPRNFLDEKYIFQFEKLDYNSSQTKDGVEKILAGTWMYNSNITYKDKNGKNITYSPATKYSEAIMKAAKDSGLSAYYLASKIVQEVGSSSASNAGGSSGTVKGYEGIYNYYNLNAYTGAVDGLKWASLSGYYTNTNNVNLREEATVSSKILATIPLWTIVNVKKSVPASDGYYWYNVSLTLNGKSYTGYIRSDLVAKDYYNRPWTDPYKSIINGAQYIADSFGKTQNTGYLQKFNVNPASPDRHSHEYMANVSAAATEAYKTYTAFQGTGALSGKTTFIIPVYNEMELSAPTLKAAVNANGTFTLSWNKVAGASKYDLYIKQADGSYKVMKTTTATSFTTAVAAYGKQYAYKMKAIGSSTSDFSNTVNAVNNKKLTTPSMKAAINANGTFKLSWNKVAGADKYELYIKQANGSYKLMKTTTATSFTTAVAAYGKQYSYKMRAVNSKNSSLASAYSSVVNATNNKKLQTPTMKVTVNANGSFKLYWNAVAGATSYQLYIKQTDGSYKLMKTTTATSFTTAVAAYGKQYAYKMRAVTSKNSSATSAYSAAVNAKNTKKLQTPSLKAAVNKNGSFKLSWGKVTGAEKYELYIRQANGTYKLMKTTTSTSFTTAVAAKGKTYSYKMRAVTSKNKNATSNYSSVVSAKRK